MLHPGIFREESFGDLGRGWSLRVFKKIMFDNILALELVYPIRSWPGSRRDRPMVTLGFQAGGDGHVFRIWVDRQIISDFSNMCVTSCR